jgi:hypothetical protein
MRRKQHHPVTDHALVRWLERGHGMDMEFFREQLRQQVQPMIDAKASGGYLPCGLWACIENGRLMSVWPNRPDWHARGKNDIRRMERAAR